MNPFLIFEESVPGVQGTQTHHQLAQIWMKFIDEIEKIEKAILDLKKFRS